MWPIFFTKEILWHECHFNKIHQLLRILKSSSHIVVLAPHRAHTEGDPLVVAYEGYPELWHTFLALERRHILR